MGQQEVNAVPGFVDVDTGLVLFFVRKNEIGHPRRIRDQFLKFESGETQKTSDHRHFDFPFVTSIARRM